MIVLAVKLLLAPSFVAGASMAARRYGPWVGGALAGLPVVAGPILLVYALTHGGDFTQRAATGALLGLCSLTAFVLVYGRLAARAGWLTCVLCGWIVFAAFTLIFDGVSVSPTVALSISCAGLAVGVLGLPASSVGEIGAAAPPWDLVLRGGCALVLVLALTTASGWLGPRLSGLLAPFPVITTVMAAFTHAQRGSAETVRLLRGLLAGYVAFAVFCFTLAISIHGSGVLAAFLLATAAALLGQVVIVSCRFRAIPFVSYATIPRRRKR